MNFEKKISESAKASIDKESTGWKAFVGYQFTPNLGAEAFYADFGKSEFKALWKDGDEVKNGSGSIEAKGLGIAGTITWPLNEQFDVYGKGGFMYWDTSISLKPKNLSKIDSKKGFSPMFGLGAKYAINDQFSVKVEWERYMSVGDKSDFKGMDIDLISAGIVYSF